MERGLAEYQADQQRLDELQDAADAANVEREKAILQPFFDWLCVQMPEAMVGSKIWHDYTNAFFTVDTTYISVEGDQCVSDDCKAVWAWIYERFTNA